MVTIPRGCNGPPDSGQGGWSTGIIAEQVGLAASVSLRAAPPLETAMTFERDGEVVRLRHGEVVVGEGRPKTLDVEVPRVVTWEEAQAGMQAYLAEIAPTHPFPTCLGCGPARATGDALRIFAGPVADGDLVAAPWEVTDVLGLGDVTVPFIWAAMDCPTGMAFNVNERGEARVRLLANLAVEISELPRFGERCVIAAWPLGNEGRKWTSGGALFGNDGRVLATAEALWIEPRASHATASR